MGIIDITKQSFTRLIFLYDRLVFGERKSLIGFCNNADLNDDGLVDGQDFQIVKKNIGQSDP